MNRSKQKGDREERAVVHFFLENKIECERTLESGARSNSQVTWDINLHAHRVLKGECKVRKDGFKQIYDWIKDRDFLTIRANNSERLFVVPESVLQEIIKEASC